MAYFTEEQIQRMMTALRWEWGIENDTRELAVLELEDLQRKGCSLENIGECRGCSTCKDGHCPLEDWEKRHPEYANDELAKKIEILEAGGEEAYKAKQKAREEAKRIAEEEAQKATDTDRVEACRSLLRLFRKAKLSAVESRVLDRIENILHGMTKAEIWDEVHKTV